MKKLTYILLPVILLSVLYSCNKESLITYNVADNIYFKFDSSTDSLDVSFAFSGTSVQDSIVKIPVHVTGVPADQDRTFVIEADPVSTAVENTHYFLPKTFVIHTGLVTDSIPIKLIRAEDLQSRVVRLILTLKTGGDFNADLEAEDWRIRKTYRITVSDMLTAGSFWGSLNQYFGSFSVKKVQLLHEVTGMPLEFIAATSPNYWIVAQYYALIMNRYLLDQIDEGNPVYEEDGVTLMTMGSAVQ